jgi:Nucleotidyl transferase of unknown function (DUF2204)
MAEPIPPSLILPLADLGKWLRGIPTKSVIVGGVAVSFLGRPRFTQDIDALVILPESTWERALTTAPDYGIVARIEDALTFAQRSRVLLLRHVASSIDIDVILGGLSFEQSSVDNAVFHRIGGLDIPLPRVEDLLTMKAVAHRPQDMQDVQTLLEANSNVDVESVRRWVREFGIATAMSDLIKDFDNAVARWREAR